MAKTLIEYMRMGLSVREGAWPAIRETCYAEYDRWHVIFRSRSVPDCDAICVWTRRWLDAIGIDLRVEIFEPLATNQLRNGMISFSHEGLPLHRLLMSFHRETRSFCGLYDLAENLGRRIRPVTHVHGVLQRSLVRRLFVKRSARARKDHAGVLQRFPFEEVSLPGFAVSASLYASREMLHRIVPTNEEFSFLPSSTRVGQSLEYVRNAFAAGAGWFIELPRALFVVPVPRFHLDREFRLHSADSPALEWCDGLKEYCWHGVHVRPDFIMRPETISVGQILAEQNAEIRRMMIDRIGLERFVTETKAKTLHVDYDAGGKRELLRIRLTRDEPLVLVKVICPSTKRAYFLRVPPAMRTCDEAIAWTFGFTRSAYAPAKET